MPGVRVLHRSPRLFTCGAVPPWSLDMKRLPLVVAVASALSVACRDRDLPLAPASGRPAFLISDGAHTGGNADFFFLPPLVPDPSGSPNFDGGKFNAQLAPIVEVCELGADPRLVPTTDCVAGDPVFGPVTLRPSRTAARFRSTYASRTGHSGRPVEAITSSGSYPTWPPL